MDLGEYVPVHIIADLTRAPLLAGSVESVVSNSVLEHIYDYNVVINEVFRMLERGVFLFMCPKCLFKAS